MSLWTLLADGSDDVATYEFSRLQAYTERWHYLVLGVICAALVAFVAAMYRRDSVELRPGVGWLLAVLRVAAFAGLLIYYLGMEKRTQREVIHNSRVLVLVDTSLSMSLRDNDSSLRDSDSSTAPAGGTRLERAVAALDEGGLIEQLRHQHEVVLARFDSELSRIVTFGKLPEKPAPAAPGDKRTAAESTDKRPSEEQADWRKSLVPQGSETRLGQALRNLLNDERAAPVAAVVLFSDGGQNAGIDVPAAIETAREAGIPIFAVGLGSARPPANVWVSDLVVPVRAFPGDSFTVTGYLQSRGLSSDQEVTVELLSKPADGADKSAEGQLEGSTTAQLREHGEVVPVKFDITPKETGRRTFVLRVKAPAVDKNDSDNQQEADIEIIDRKTKVLLVASGPTREYIFLRNLLRRDRGMVVDVWLQSAQGTVSQDANQILDQFPSSPQELYEYDCIVAFDPDWTQLDADQIDLLERWVAERAGGLIALAGPVETDGLIAQAAKEPRLSKIVALYPVEFNRRLTNFDEGRFRYETPWPIDFTREGLEAEFLWLADGGPKSQQVWSSFPGIYGYFSTRGAKPGATVYARFSDPEAREASGQPVTMAGQFYGSGRVFYLGSGEMWRLRALDESYFEQFYTKLIRHVSQGRLLVGSSHGMLLVDRDRYQLGNTVAVRAQLSNAQFEPLDLPNVPLEIVQPSGAILNLQLAADATRKGMYLGQFTALETGMVHLEMNVPEAGQEPLSRRILVKMPDLEMSKPERNDALLHDLAEQTGGRYYPIDELPGEGELAGQIPSRTEKTILAGATDRDFERQWMSGILALVCGALSLEWLIRRLSKLA